MNPLHISIALFAALNLVIAQDKRDSRKSGMVRGEDSEICTRELEGIVYQPENAARSYLDRIADQIRAASPILWTSSETSFLESMQVRYGVSITVMSPFRYITFPAEDVDEPRFYKSVTSTANMNGNGFARDTDADQVIDFEFIVHNVNNEMKYIFITMPLANAPLLNH